MGRYSEAIELFKQAILLNPNSGASYSSLGSAYINLDQASGEIVALAHANYEKAVAVEPENSDLHHNLGESYQRGGRLDLALSSFDRAIELNPGNAKARWMRFMLWAPAFSSKDDTDSPNRSGFESELARFEDWWLGSETDGAIFVGEAQPFFLTYQEENNLALLKRYGRVCAMAMQRWLDRQKSPPFIRPVEKRIRLGIVSPDIRLHSVWMALIKGWLQSFDRERFELVVFSLTDRPDSETTWASENSDVFIGGTKNSHPMGHRDPRTELRNPALSRRRTASVGREARQPAVGATPGQYLGSSGYLRLADTGLVRIGRVLRAHRCAGSLFRAAPAPSASWQPHTAVELLRVSTLISTR